MGCEMNDKAAYTGQGLLGLTSSSPVDVSQAATLGGPPVGWPQMTPFGLLNATRDSAFTQAIFTVWAFEEIGDLKTAKAIRKAIKIRRPRGRPPEWTNDERTALSIDIWQILHAYPSLKVSSACRTLSKRKRWSEFSGAALAYQYREWKKKQDPAILEAYELQRQRKRAQEN